MWTKPCYEVREITQKIWVGECANMYKNTVTRCEKSAANIWEGECANMYKNTVTRCEKSATNIWEGQCTNMDKTLLRGVSNHSNTFGKVSAQI